MALGIVSLLAQEDDRGETLSKVSRILDSAPHGDAHDSTRLEGDIARLIGASGGARQGSTRLGSKEFEAYLRPINDYFVVEYQLLLEELSQLAAKCLLNAGDRASSRLDDLKKAGFKGLGLIERMDMPRLLLVLFSVAASGFVTFYLLGFGAGRGGAAGAGQEMPDRNIMMAAISLILAAAALIGAFVGSIGSLTLSPTVPWKRYLQAGMIGVLAFFLIHGAQFTAFGDPISKRQANIAALKSKGPGLALADQAVIRPPSTTKNVNALARIAPFSILPFCIVVGMCLLARLPGYWTPALVARSRFATVAWERSLDGIAMCVVLFAGFASAFFVSSTLGMMPKPDVSTTPGADGPRMLSALLQFGVLGFLIGAIVLRDVRMAAHAQIVTGERPPGRTITQAS